MNRKTVGIIMRPWDSSDVTNYLLGFSIDTFLFFKDYDVNVIGIPMNYKDNFEFEKIKSIIDFCDGIIFPGGKCEYEEDKEIIKYLYDVDKPTLGICLGMQIISNLFSGNKKELIENNLHNSNYEYAHTIKINKDSKLFEILNKDRIMVNSHHYYKIKNTDLNVSAISIDNVIEAIEDKNKKFFIGVQWHPELLHDQNSKRLIKNFIKTL